jgi:hypothetical protein
MWKSENDSFRASVFICFKRQQLANSSEVHLTKEQGYQLAHFLYEMHSLFPAKAHIFLIALFFLQKSPFFT